AQQGGGVHPLLARARLHVQDARSAGVPGRDHQDVRRSAEVDQARARNRRATRSRWNVASPKATSFAFARLKYRCMSFSHVKPIPPWIWIPLCATRRYASAANAFAIEIASDESGSARSAAHAA